MARDGAARRIQLRVLLKQVFLLSPASCSGQRAAMLFNERAEFFLARQLRERGAPLGDVFSFLSGLYFRGKLSYARAFAGGPAEHGSIIGSAGTAGSRIHVIT